MRISNIKGDFPEIPVNTLFGLQRVRPYYFVTKNNLIFNQKSNSYCAINMTHSGYAYVTLALDEEGSDTWQKITLHKIIALARIKNQSYKCIEHINDNPLDLRVQNLKFSSYKENVKSAFINKHRNISSDLFRVELFDGRVFEGTLKQIQEKTGISKITLYDRFYKGPRETSWSSRQKVKAVTKLDKKETTTYISNRLIDYRNGKFQGKIILDNLTIDFSTE